MSSYKCELQKMFDLQKFGMKFGLESMRSILEKLGNPHHKLKLVHLAGTNGKGSVGAMLQSVLGSAGYKTGFYSSPHLVTFRERIKICGELISEDEILALNSRIWAATDKNAPPTFFEFVTALAFLYFAEKGVELAIIEVGLGGRLDSTNVIEPLVAAITNVALEHVEHLGDTVGKIAAEKAGIIKSGVPLVCGFLDDEAREVVFARARELSSSVLALARDFKVEKSSVDSCGRLSINYQQGALRFDNLALGLAGPHQADNAAVVIAILSLLAEKGFACQEEYLRRGLAIADWPGRAELFAPGQWPPEGKPAVAHLLLDGAHNPAGAEALANMLKNFVHRRLHVIVGVMADKDIGGILGPILAQADRLYLSRPLFSRAASPELLHEKIVAAFGALKIPCTLHPRLPEAFRAAADEAGDGDLVLLAGSLFTVGEGRAYLSGIAEVESN